MNKTAIITGVTGQDGSYLAEFLLSKDYCVVGIKRRTSSNNLHRLVNVLNNPNFILVDGDVTDLISMMNIVDQYKPHEFYNLAGQSQVYVSFNQPIYTWDVDARGCLNSLEAIKQFAPKCKFYQSSSSEMFGSSFDVDNNGQKYQDEHTPMLPNSPYGIAKLSAHHTVRLYRDAYNIYACAGILYNHESSRRGEEFVTKKIAQYVGKLYKLRIQEYSFSLAKLKLGNLSAYRDWGFAGDYVEAMWLILQQTYADDYVVGTGKVYSVEDFLVEAFKYIGIDDYREYVDIDKQLLRPVEVPYLCSKPTRIESLGWKPKVNFKQLVQMMVDNEKVYSY